VKEEDAKEIVLAEFQGNVPLEVYESCPESKDTDVLNMYNILITKATL
jgi:hypothetical protein